MPRLIACPHCQSHARSTEARCPQCASSLRPRGGTLARTAAAALLGLAPIACDKGGGDTTPPADGGGLAEPEYGAPMTDEPGAPDDPPADPGPGAAGPHDDPDFAAEYGVPATDDLEELNEPTLGDAETPEQ